MEIKTSNLQWIYPKYIYGVSLITLNAKLKFSSELVSSTLSA